MSSNVSYDNITVNQSLSLSNLATITSACDLQITAGNNQHLVLTTSGTGNTRIQTGSLSKTLFAGTVTYNASIGVNTIPLFKAILPTSNSLGDIKLYLKTSDQLGGLKFEEFSGSIQAMNTSMYQLSVCGVSTNMGLSSMQALGKSNATGATIVTFQYTFSVGVASTLVAWFFAEWYGDNATVFSPINFPTVVNTSSTPVSSTGAIAGSSSSGGTSSSASGTRLSAFVDDITPPLYAAINAEAGSISAITSQISNQTGSVTSANVSITSHTSSLTGLNATITSLNSASIALAQSVTSQSAIVTLNSANITSLTNAIIPLSNLGTFVSASLTVLTSVVSANSSSLTSLQNNLSTTAADATSATASITSIANAVNTQTQILSGLTTSVTNMQVVESQISSSVSAFNTTLINQTATIQAFGGSITTNAANIGTLQSAGSLTAASLTSLTVQTGSFSTLLSNVQVVQTALSASVTTNAANLGTLSINTNILSASVTSLQQFGKGQILLAESFYAIDAVDTIASGTALPGAITLPDNGNLTVISAGTSSSYQTDTPALRFVGAVQLSIDLTQPPYYLSFSTLNAYIAAGYSVFFSYKVAISRGGGAVSASPWPNTAFRLLFNTTSSTDSTTNQFVDIVNDASVGVGTVSNQVDVTSLFTNLSSAVVTIYSNITTPNYLNLYSLGLVAVPANLTVTGLLTSGTTTAAIASFGTITGSSINLPGSSFINLASDQAGKAAYGGNIGYQLATAGAVDVFGAGASVGARNVKVWDNVAIPGTISASVGTLGTITSAFASLTNCAVSGSISAGSARISSNVLIGSGAASSSLYFMDMADPTIAIGASKYIGFGYGPSQNNEAQIYFTYQGSNSVSNALGLGFNGNLNKLTILANGNVGVNTAVPLYNLDIAGSARISGTILASSLSSNFGSLTQAYTSTLTVGTILNFSAGGSIGTNLALIGTLTAASLSSSFGSLTQAYTSTLSVGTILNFSAGGSIGTNLALSGTLTAASISTTFLNAATLSAGTYLNVVFNQSISSSGTTSGTYSSGTLTVGGGGSFLGTITTTGLGINQTTPAYPLDVNGSARLSGTGTPFNSLVLQNSGGGGGPTTSGAALSFRGYQLSTGFTAQIKSTDGQSGNYGGQLQFLTKPANNSDTNNLTEVMRITDTGQIGIGTTAPAYTLDISGSCRVTGTITAPSPTWLFPSVASAFTQYGGEWASVSYSKDGFGKVYLRGFLTYNGTANTTTVIFTLPSGMYPPYNSQFSVTSLSTTATGCVLVCGANAASSAGRYPGQVTYNGFSGNYFSLDSISFFLNY